MAEEKVVVLNLRKKLLKTPKWKRSKELMGLLKKIIEKQGSKKITIDKKLNEKIWSRSIENPPTKLRVKIIKPDDKSVRVELLE